MFILEVSGFDGLLCSSQMTCFNLDTPYNRHIKASGHPNKQITGGVSLIICQAVTLFVDLHQRQNASACVCGWVRPLGNPPACVPMPAIFREAFFPRRGLEKSIFEHTHL